MPSLMNRSVTVASLLLACAHVFAEEVDLEVVQRIKAEAFDNSRVMEHMALLSDVHGPRLAGSPGYLAAAEAVVDAMREMGVESRIETPARFGRSWSYSDIHVQQLTPVKTTLAALPMAWSSATDGAVRAPVIMAPLRESADDTGLTDNLLRYAERIEAYKTEYRGKLGGKAVLLNWPNNFETPEQPEASRYDTDTLADIATAPEPLSVPPLTWPLWELPSEPAVYSRFWEVMPIEVQQEWYSREQALTNRLYEFLVDEGVAGILMVSDHPFGGAVASDYYGSYVPGTVVAPPTVVVMAEQYNRIVRLIQRDMPVEVELRVDATMHAEEVDLRNVMATLQGGAKRDEWVLLGGHLDSWIGGTGASDNAAGCAVAMEAMRILKALDLKLDRSVRMALWDGEEQGYYGSRAYVRANFGDPVTQEVRRDHAKFSAYYNVDNGAGRIRGVYLQSNEAARPVFEAWFAPFADLGVDTISIRNTTETDHLAFDAVGLPGFQFIQDPLEYELRTHHTNLDTVDHVVPGDLMQAAAVLATIVYHTANRPGLMPRKAAPTPLPPKQSVPKLIEGPQDKS